MEPDGTTDIGLERGAFTEFQRLSFAVYDIAPAPQQGQLMATRMFCFCSSSRSVRSSIARVCCSNNWCSGNALEEIGSSDAGSVPAGAALGAGLLASRSEERRVGKECKTRWPACQCEGKR